MERGADREAPPSAAPPTDLRAGFVAVALAGLAAVPPALTPLPLAEAGLVALLLPAVDDTPLRLRALLPPLGAKSESAPLVRETPESRRDMRGVAG